MRTVSSRSVYYYETLAQHCLSFQFGRMRIRSYPVLYRHYQLPAPSNLIIVTAQRGLQKAGR